MTYLGIGNKKVSWKIKKSSPKKNIWYGKYRENIKNTKTKIKSKWKWCIIKKRYWNIIVWVMFGPNNYNLACELRGIST